LQDAYEELCEDKLTISLLSNHGVIGSTTWKVHLISHGALLALLVKRGAPTSFLMAFKAMDVAGSFNHQQVGGGDMPTRGAGYLSPSETIRAMKKSSKGAVPRPGSSTGPRGIRASTSTWEEDVGEGEAGEDEEEAPPAAPRHAAPRPRLRDEPAAGGDSGSGSDSEGEVVGLGGRSMGWRLARGFGQPVQELPLGAAARGAAYPAVASSQVPARGLEPGPGAVDPCIEALRRAVEDEAELAKQGGRARLGAVRPDEAALAEMRREGSLNKRFGLKRDEVPADLQKEMDLLISSATDPGLNLLRAGVFTTSLAPSTVDRLAKDICKYMGYLKNVKGWPYCQLSLVAYSNLTCFFDYIEFLAERAVETVELKKQTKVAMNMNEFVFNLMSLRDKGTAADVHKEACKHLDKLMLELCSRDRKEKGTKIREEVKLPSASQSMAFVQRVMDEAVKEVDKLEGPLQQGDKLPFSLASRVRDAAMLAMTVGHVGLAVRIKAVRTVKSPEFADTVCTDPTCNNAKCKGNLIIMEFPDELELEEEDVAEAEPVCAMHLPHHKNSGRGIAMPKVPITSPGLVKLLVLWTKHGRPRFVEMAKEASPGWQDPETLFISAQGKSFQGLTAWYKTVHMQYRAPYPYLSINTYRKVFVTDRLENPDRPGPSNEGAALIMGNSEKQWQASYWPNKMQKLAEGAVHDMGMYRSSLLAEAGYYQEDVGEGDESEEDV
jgi:hypothetical protein